MFQLRLVRHSTDDCSSLKGPHRLFKCYQKTVHNDTDQECDFETFLNFLVDSSVTVGALLFQKHNTGFFQCIVSVSIKHASVTGALYVSVSIPLIYLYYILCRFILTITSITCRWKYLIDSIGWRLLTFNRYVTYMLWRRRSTLQLTGLALVTARSTSSTGWTATNW